MKRVALVSLALVGAAHAQSRDFGYGVSDPLVMEPKKSFASPQHFALEIKFGPYSPDIDSTPGLTGHPFSELFVAQDGPDVGKRPPGKLLTTLEFDYQFWRTKFGSLGVGGSVGINYRTTHSFQYQDAVNHIPCQVPNCVRSGDETSLGVMPFALEVVYRFDLLANHYSVPLVPYFKGGLAYYLWWITNGSGDLSRALQVNADGSTDQAIGGTFGLVLHPGLAVQLDILDRAAARELDGALGINHTYVFCELNYAWITGFGSSSKLVFSDLSWNVGLAFEF